MIEKVVEGKGGEEELDRKAMNDGMAERRKCGLLNQSIQSFPDTGTWRESSTIRRKM